MLEPKVRPCVCLVCRVRLSPAGSRLPAASLPHSVPARQEWPVLGLTVP